MQEFFRNYYGYYSLVLHTLIKVMFLGVPFWMLRNCQICSNVMFAY